MERTQLLNVLLELSASFGPPGQEEEVAAICRRHLEGRAVCRRDRLGSLVAEFAGDGPRVMLAAHLDEVGLMVKAVTAEGYLRFLPLGAWWEAVLPGTPVRLKGRTGEVRGVIGSRPPHFLRTEERRRPLAFEEMFIDVGAGSLAAAKAMGLEAGVMAVPDVSPEVLAGGVVRGKALDDRVGVAALLAVAKRLAAESHPNTILVVGTVQEEIGGRGGRTAAQMLHPDVCLVLEGTPADDLPGTASELVQGGLGRGPQIRIFDPSMIGNRRLIEMVREEAETRGIPYQLAVRETGGTDGGTIHLVDLGVPTLVLGIPVRYAHAPACLASLDDLEKTVELVSALIRRLDMVTVGRL
ncbi:MAG: M42 family metallopeptidase [Firmicutes bacterium]|nr:M42 family metallopeptidase [Bacillota bacterium]